MLRGGLLSQLGNLRRVRDQCEQRAQSAITELSTPNLDESDVAAALARGGAYNDISIDLTAIITTIERLDPK